MTRSRRIGLLALEGVEDTLAFIFNLRGLGGVIAEDEQSGDEADQEADEEGGHLMSDC